MSIQQLENEARSKYGPRPLYTFKIPAKVGVETQAVSIVQLTAGEEMMAAKRSMGDPVALSYELAKESLRRIDGKPVSTGDGSADSWWENPNNAKARTLVVTAYNQVNSVSRDDNADFLASCEVTTG
jgi:hypothetical protein